MSSRAQADVCPERLVDGVLFDLDGTLIDTLELILTSMRHATLTVLGAPLADEVLMHNVGVPLAQQMREFSDEHADDLLRVYREHNETVHDALVREYAGVSEALVRLSAAGFRMGIVTSKMHRVAARGIDLFGLGEHFEFLIGSDDVAIHKPDPFPLLRGAELLGIEPGRCAYVGDSPHDMAAASSAGMIAVGALWGVASRERLIEAGARYEARDMGEVVDVVCGYGDRLLVN